MTIVEGEPETCVNWATRQDESDWITTNCVFLRAHVCCQFSKWKTFVASPATGEEKMFSFVRPKEVEIEFCLLYIKCKWRESEQTMLSFQSSSASKRGLRGMRTLMSLEANVNAEENVWGLILKQSFRVRNRLTDGSFRSWNGKCRKFSAPPKCSYVEFCSRAAPQRSSIPSLELLQKNKKTEKWIFISSPLLLFRFQQFRVFPANMNFWWRLGSLFPC